MLWGLGIGVLGLWDLGPEFFGLGFGGWGWEEFGGLLFYGQRTGPCCF